jgi:hypothetical protein
MLMPVRVWRCSNGVANNNVAPIIRGFPQKTLFKLFEESGHTWASYFALGPSPLAFKDTRVRNGNNYVHFSQFDADARAGRLPTFTHIDPRYFDVPCTCRKDRGRGGGRGKGCMQRRVSSHAQREIEVERKHSRHMSLRHAASVRSAVAVCAFGNDGREDADVHGGRVWNQRSAPTTTVRGYLSARGCACACVIMCSDVYCLLQTYAHTCTPNPTVCACRPGARNGSGPASDQGYLRSSARLARLE